MFRFVWIWLVVSRSKKNPFHRRLTVAEHVLLRNYLNQDEFAEAVRVLLREGKYRNILLTGFAGCGKTLSNSSKLCFRTVFVSLVRPRSLWLILSVLTAMKWFSQMTFVGVPKLTHGTIFTSFGRSQSSFTYTQNTFRTGCWLFTRLSNILHQPGRVHLC